MAQDDIVACKSTSSMAFSILEFLVWISLKSRPPPMTSCGIWSKHRSKLWTRCYTQRCASLYPWQTAADILPSFVKKS